MKVCSGHFSILCFCISPTIKKRIIRKRIFIKNFFTKSFFIKSFFIKSCRVPRTPDPSRVFTAGFPKPGSQLRSGLPGIAILQRCFGIGLMVVVGCTSADFNAGLNAYQNGDYEQSFVEWSKAARTGNGDAQYRLGTLYEDGVGTRQDLMQAYKWYEIAARAGVQFASDSRDSTAQRLNADQLAKARQLVDEFVPESVDAVESSPALLPTASPQLVREVQRQLNRLGFAVGPEDGQAGERTQGAIRFFQQQNGMVVDGRVSEPLREALVQRPTPGEPTLTPADSGSEQPVQIQSKRSIGDGETIESSVEVVPAATEEVASSSNSTTVESESRPESESTPTPTPTPEQTTAADGQTSIAIFPLASKADDRFFGDTICEEIVSAIKPQQYSRYRLVYASNPCTNDETVRLPDELNSKTGIKTVWKQSFFGAKPIAESVAEHGRRLGVDVVMLFVVKEPLSWENPGAVELLVQRMFVIDTADATQWSLPGSPGVTIQGDVRTEIPQLARKLLTKYKVYNDL